MDDDLIFEGLWSKPCPGAANRPFLPQLFRFFQELGRKEIYFHATGERVLFFGAPGNTRVWLASADFEEFHFAPAFSRPLSDSALELNLIDVVRYNNRTRLKIYAPREMTIKARRRLEARREIDWVEGRRFDAWHYRNNFRNYEAIEALEYDAHLSVNLLKFNGRLSAALREDDQFFVSPDPLIQRGRGDGVFRLQGKKLWICPRSMPNSVRATVPPLFTTPLAKPTEDEVVNYYSLFSPFQEVFPAIQGCVFPTQACQVRFGRGESAPMRVRLYFTFASYLDFFAPALPPSRSEG